MFNRLVQKNLHTWIGGYVRHLLSSVRTARTQGPRHLIFTFCDHYEPLWGGADDATGETRVRSWHKNYPEMSKRFFDADGKNPQHTFFFPGEEYRPIFFDLLDDLVRGGGGEVELHLHHDNATAASMRADIERYLEIYASRGHFSRASDGRVRYAFIHGNWALANGRPDGRKCGVDAELPLLFDTGCYADLTFPSAPDITQPGTVNQIYWPTGDLSRKRSYENGERAKVGKRYYDRLLMIEGPIAIARKNKSSLSARIEASAVTAKDPATASRIRCWVDQNIHVQGCEQWVFVKVHTHGAPEKQAASLLADGGLRMHEELNRSYNDGKNWVLHYATAREMYNIAMAAMAGRSGDPNLFRDFELAPPPIVRALRK